MPIPGAGIAQDVEMRDAGQGQITALAVASEAVPQQQRSKVVKPGEKRTKKGKRRINSAVPPPLATDDYVRVVPVSKRSEVCLHSPPPQNYNAFMP